MRAIVGVHEPDNAFPAGRIEPVDRPPPALGVAQIDAGGPRMTGIETDARPVADGGRQPRDDVA